MTSVPYARLGWIALAIVASLLFAAPVLIAAALGSDYLTIAPESTAYRFFFVDRLAAREPSDLWLPQGYLTTMLHQLVYAAMVPGDELPTRLRDTVNTWAVLSSLAVCLIPTVALVIGLSASWLPPLAKAGLVVAALGPRYATGTATFYFGFAPDYYLTTMALAPVVVLAFAWVSWCRPPLPPAAVVLGVLVGLTASNKVSLVFVAGLPLVVLAAQAFYRPLRALFVLAMGGISALIAFALVHQLVYGFDLAMVLRVAPLWWAFVRNPGSQPDFWARLGTIVVAYHYHQIAALLVLAVFAAGVALARRGRGQATHWIALVGIMGTTLLAVHAVVLRPADTTALDAAIVAFALLGCLVVLEARSRWPWIFVAGVAMLAVLTYPVRAHAWSFEYAASRAPLIWQIHDRILETSRPAIVVIQDNNYAFGSVEEALLKGYARFPTWDVVEGQAALDRFAPGMTFRSEQSQQTPAEPYPDDATVVVFDRTDLGRVADRYPALREALDHRACDTIAVPPSTAVTICQPQP